MAHDDVKFGRVLEQSSSDRKVWFLVIPAILALMALGGYGIYGASQASTVKGELAATRARADELQKTVDQRDELLVAARADEAVLRSPGQATAVFYGVDPEAVESGLALAIPSQQAAKVVLYGLQPPPEGQRYTLAARAEDGTLTSLRDVEIGADGSAFLIARGVPEGTSALELVLRDASLAAAGGAAPAPGEAAGEPPAGGAGEGEGAAPPEEAASAVPLDGATPRIAARYPGAEERGVLTQPPSAQARRGVSAGRSP